MDPFDTIRDPALYKFLHEMSPEDRHQLAVELLQKIGEGAKFAVGRIPANASLLVKAAGRFGPGLGTALLGKEIIQNSQGGWEEAVKAQDARTGGNKFAYAIDGQINPATITANAGFKAIEAGKAAIDAQVAHSNRIDTEFARDMAAQQKLMERSRAAGDPGIQPQMPVIPRQQQSNAIEPVGTAPQPEDPLVNMSAIEPVNTNRYPQPKEQAQPLPQFRNSPVDLVPLVNDYPNIFAN